jgi:hypothetical protein
LAAEEAKHCRSGASSALWLSPTRDLRTADRVQAREARVVFKIIAGEAAGERNFHDVEIHARESADERRRRPGRRRASAGKRHRRQGNSGTDSRPSTHGEVPPARLVKSSLAESIAAAHIAASVVVAHFEAGEIFGGIRRCGRCRSGQPEAKAQNPPAPLARNQALTPLLMPPSKAKTRPPHRFDYAIFGVAPTEGLATSWRATIHLQLQVVIFSHCQKRDLFNAA